MGPRYAFIVFALAMWGCEQRVASPVCSADTLVMEEGPNRVRYHIHLQDALRCSRETGRPVLLLFDAYAQSNRACWDVLANDDVQALIRDRLVLCVLMVDDRELITPDDLIGFPQIKTDPTTIGQRNIGLEREYFATSRQPLFTLVDTEFRPLAEPMGYIPKKSPELLVDWIRSTLDHLPGERPKR